MKKAFNWLNEQGIQYEFHDYKKEGLSQSLVESWLKQLPPEELINKRGTTWRKLDDEVKNNLNKTTAKKIAVEHTSAIKRPLLDVDGQFYLGFKPELYAGIFNE